MDVQHNANLNITGALTIEAWVKTNSTAFQMVLERGDWNQALMSYDLMIGDGKIRMDIKESSGNYVALIGKHCDQQGSLAPHRRCLYWQSDESLLRWCTRWYNHSHIDAYKHHHWTADWSGHKYLLSVYL